MTTKDEQPVITPGAAYLWNGTLCLSDAEGELAYLTSDGFQIVSVVPSDTVILLYAPGDKVIPGVPSEWRAVVYKGDSDVEYRKHCAKSSPITAPWRTAATANPATGTPL